MSTAAWFCGGMLTQRSIDPALPDAKEWWHKRQDAWCLPTKHSEPPKLTLDPRQHSRVRKIVQIFGTPIVTRFSRQKATRGYWGGACPPNNQGRQN